MSKKTVDQTSSYDFEDTELAKATPYGVNDIGKNQGWVIVGIDHDTAQFAVRVIGSWPISQPILIQR